MFHWRDIPKIDAHIHLMPEDVIEANREYKNKFVVNGSAVDYVKLMDKYNIDQAFIMPFNDPHMLSMEFTIESVHNNLLDIAQNNKGKLFCFADIDIRRNVSDSLSEFDRVFQKKSFLGIKIHPTNAGYPIDGFYYDEIFNYAQKHNILLEIHSYPRENLEDDVCSPKRIKKMLAKYPNIRVCISHLGGFQYEQLIGTDAYVNISAILTDLVERYGLEKANQILRSFNVNRLVFASDFPDNRQLKPDEIYDKYFEILDAMDFTIEEAEDICKNNALDLIDNRSTSLL